MRWTVDKKTSVRDSIMATVIYTYDFVPQDFIELVQFALHCGYIGLAESKRCSLIIHGKQHAYSNSAE